MLLDYLNNIRIMISSIDVSLPYYRIDQNLSERRKSGKEGESDQMDRLFFTWVEPLLTISSRKSLEYSNLLSHPSDMTSEALFLAFQSDWDKQKKVPPSSSSSLFSCFSCNQFPALWHVMHHLIFSEYWYAGFCRLVNDLLVLAGPLLIEYVVKAAESADGRQVFFYSTLLLLSSLLQVSVMAMRRWCLSTISLSISSLFLMSF